MAKSRQKTVYVAMSGGVDSSVAAALLKKRGFHVIGVFMKPWQSPGVRCLWQKDREDALRVATVLDIPLLTWDFSKEYGTRVTRYMIDGYRRGITPNPDIMCNKEIKFGLFFKKAMDAGADFVATGHYARIKNSILYTAKDTNKDQTYFLWTLAKKQFSQTLFPIGDYTKPQVRILAKNFGLPVYNKKDSQGVCFVGALDMKSFLKRHIKSRSGPIIHVRGTVLGRHDGVAYYTIGQRHGMNITVGGGPYYVVGKNMRTSTLFVGEEKDLFSSTAKITGMHWNTPAQFPIVVDVKIRYRTQAQRAVLAKNGVLRFKKPQRAITPGQSAVFYRGKKILGGGIIVGRD